MAGPIINQFGRQGGRGVRPWLLMPKLLAVCVYLGSLTTCTALYFLKERHAANLDLIGWLLRFVAIPALLAAAVFGILLFLQHPATFIRMRWLRVKLAVLGLGVPAAHLFMSSRLQRLREAVGNGASETSAARQLAWGFVILLAGSIFVMFLGRHKPRLGLNWARSFASTRTNAFLGAMLACLALMGCQWTWPVRETARTGLPSDFSMQFIVESASIALDPVKQPGIYVLESDRNLRMAQGPVGRTGLYPRVVRRLSQRQYASIVGLIEDRDLLAEPISPIGEQVIRGHSERGYVIYHVDLTMNGRMNRYVTTPEESPPTQLLLKLLLAADGEEGLP